MRLGDAPLYPCGCRWGGHPGRAVCPESSDGHPCWHVPGRQFDMVRHRSLTDLSMIARGDGSLRWYRTLTRLRAWARPGRRGGGVEARGVDGARPPILRNVGAPPLDQQGAPLAALHLRRRPSISARLSTCHLFARSWAKQLRRLARSPARPHSRRRRVIARRARPEPLAPLRKPARLSVSSSRR